MNARPSLGRWLSAGAAIMAAASVAAADEVPAARVNGAVISTERLERFFEDQLASTGRSVAGIRDPRVYARLRREALDELIAQELLWQEARDAGLTATEAEVDAAVEGVRSRFRTEEAFRRRIERDGFDAATYARYVRRQLSIERLVAERVVPGRREPDDAVRRAIAEHVAALRASAAVEVLVSTGP